MNKDHAMHKAQRATSELKMKNLTGTSKNYEHSSDKAERFCSGGYARGGPVLEPGGPSKNKPMDFYGHDGMKINLPEGDK